jgi:hypothetical protein
VSATAYVEPAPTTNLSLRSGVPLEPLQRYQPDGTEATEPDQIMIPPLGNAAATAVATKAVEAI